MSTLKVKVNDEWKEVGATGSVFAGLADNVEILNSKIDSLPISNPNLLDNPWFTVNQRGQSTYDFLSSSGWTFDRWRVYRGKVVVGSNGITITSSTSAFTSLYQRIECDKTELFGKTMTLSAMIGGNVYSHTFVADSTNQSHDIGSCSIGLDGTVDNMTVYLSFPTPTTVTIRAVKLELGPKSTLAYDSAPEYQTELLKCQRYFYKVPVSIYATAIKRSGVLYSEFLQFPVEMRAVPSISGTFEFIQSDGSWSSAENLYDGFASGTINKYGVTLQKSYSGFSNFQATQIYVRDMALTADL